MKNPRNIIISIVLLLSSFLSGQDCADDATGAYIAMGQSCASVVLGFGLGCDQAFGGIPISGECPITCDNCPFDPTTCTAEGALPTTHGCCLPDFNLHITESGKVYYHSSQELGGFQFTIQGATANGVSGGDAAAAAYNIASNPATGNVLGFSMTGTSINNTGAYADNEAGGACGTLIEVELDGTPTELTGILITDPTGNITYPFVNYVPPVPGCMNSSACNFDSNANVDDGSCLIPETNYCCGATTSDPLIAQVPGYTCDGVPLEFEFNQSTQQAAYFFISVTLDGNAVVSDDWVGAFNGDKCVGALQWDTSQCGGGVCSVSIMGYTGALTSGYMIQGQIPTFKIYDASANLYFDATPSEEVQWANGSFPMIDALTGCSGGVVLDECGVCGGDGSTCAVPGCTDSSACNFDSNATADDGSCLVNDACGICGGDGTTCADVPGCTDSSACNYDSNANATVDDGSCLVNDCADECGGTAVVDVCGTCDDDPENDCGPDWDFTNEFANYSTMHAQVLVDGDDVANCLLNETDTPDICNDVGGDELAAFGPDGSIQGLAVPMIGVEAFTDLVIWELRIGSDNPGETITFQYFDASKDQIYILDESYVFKINDDFSLGHLYNPHILSYCEAGDLGCGCGEDGPSITCIDLTVVCSQNECPDFECPSGMVAKQSYLGNNDICVPLEFSSVASSFKLAFYGFNSVKIDNVDIDSLAWVGAFNLFDEVGDGVNIEEVCVGAIQWDTSTCNSGICNVPVMGDANIASTKGYMKPGQHPIFKIYDTSANDATGIYYDVVAPYSIDFDVLDGWENQNIQSNLTINIADDCNDVLGGNDQIDDCYDCKDPLEHNAAMDCAGLCYGPGEYDEYWLDEDEDGYGGNIPPVASQTFCSTLLPAGKVWATNNEDMDDYCKCQDNDDTVPGPCYNCRNECILTAADAAVDCSDDPSGTIYDCYGTPNGTASVDPCGLCTGGNTGFLVGFLQQCGCGSGDLMIPAGECDCSSVWGGEKHECDCSDYNCLAGSEACGPVGEGAEIGGCDGACYLLGEERNTFDNCGVCVNNVCAGGGNEGTSCIDNSVCLGVCGGGDGTCTGCSDQIAINYDGPSTIFTDGSCVYPQYGCTDPVAVNYWCIIDANGDDVSDNVCSGYINGKDDNTLPEIGICELPYDAAVDKVCVGGDRNGAICGGEDNPYGYDECDGIPLVYNDGTCDYPPEIGLSIENVQTSENEYDIFLTSDKRIESLSFTMAWNSPDGLVPTQSFGANGFTITMDAGASIAAGSRVITTIDYQGGVPPGLKFCFDETVGSASFSVSGPDGIPNTDDDITYSSGGFASTNITLGGCVKAVAAGVAAEIASDAGGVDIPANSSQSDATLGVGDVTEELPEEINNATGVTADELVAFTPYDLTFDPLNPASISIGSSVPSPRKGTLGRSLPNESSLALCYMVNATATEWDFIEGAICTDGTCTADVIKFGIFSTCTLQEDCNSALGGSAFLDACEKCVGGTTGKEPLYTMDECGLCDGPGYTSWWVDADDDSWGYGEEVLFCADQVPSGPGVPAYVPNNNDIEPFCHSNKSDACGECDGPCKAVPITESICASGICSVSGMACDFNWDCKNSYPSGVGECPDNVSTPNYVFDCSGDCVPGIDCGGTCGGFGIGHGRQEPEGASAGQLIGNDECGICYGHCLFDSPFFCDNNSSCDGTCLKSVDCDGACDGPRIDTGVECNGVTEYRGECIGNKCIGGFNNQGDCSSLYGNEEACIGVDSQGICSPIVDSDGFFGDVDAIVRVCFGGYRDYQKPSNQNGNCVEQADKECVGGVNDGADCTEALGISQANADTFCGAGGTCTTIIECDAGYHKGESCTDTVTHTDCLGYPCFVDEDCPGSDNLISKAECEETGECGGGGECMTNITNTYSGADLSKTCVKGINAGLACTTHADCPGDADKCMGGSQHGLSCDDHSDCIGHVFEKIGYDDCQVCGGDDTPGDMGFEFENDSDAWFEDGNYCDAGCKDQAGDKIDPCCDGECPDFYSDTDGIVGPSAGDCPLQPDVCGICGGTTGDYGLDGIPGNGDTNEGDGILDSNFDCAGVCIANCGEDGICPWDANYITADTGEADDNMEDYGDDGIENTSDTGEGDSVNDTYVGDTDCEGICGGTTGYDECGKCVDTTGDDINDTCLGGSTDGKTCTSDIGCLGICGGDGSTCTGCESRGEASDNFSTRACNYTGDTIAAKVCDDGTTCILDSDCNTGTCTEDEARCIYGTKINETTGLLEDCFNLGDCDYGCIGECVVDEDGDGQIDIDCAGVCAGEATEDVCRVCQGPGLVQEFFADVDSDSLGDPNALTKLCSIQEGFVPNSRDLLPNCQHNYFDCSYSSATEADSADTWFAACGGNKIMDCSGDCKDAATAQVFDECYQCGGGGGSNQGCGCFIDSPAYFCEDTDGDGTGNLASFTDGPWCTSDDITIYDPDQFYISYTINSADNVCSDGTFDCESPDDDWVEWFVGDIETCSDPDPYCATNDTDCNGICHGGAVEDCAGLCGGSDHSCAEWCEAGWYDCLGVCAGSAVIDKCGVCQGSAMIVSEPWCGGTPHSNCCDCIGVPNGSSFVNACGDCECDVTGTEIGFANIEATDATYPWQQNIWESSFTFRSDINITDGVCGENVCVGGSNNGGDCSGNGDIDCAGSGCHLPSSSISIGSLGQVFYNVGDTTFTGIRFNIYGATLSAVSGGEADTHGWAMIPDSSSVQAFGVASIDECGTLFTLSYNSDCIVDNDSYNCEYDCSGILNGSKRLDECGVCRDPACAEGSQYAANISSSEFNPCTGDNKYPSNTSWNASCTDCSGKLNGNAIQDMCGYCTAGNTGAIPCSENCQGVLQDNETGFVPALHYYYFDQCGTCDNNHQNDCVADCNGAWGGSVVLDECGICNGDAYVSQCSNGTCTGMDCTGVCNGNARLDNCNDCFGGTTTIDACMPDCSGIWGGDTPEGQYCYDGDGDGLGNLDITANFCSTDIELCGDEQGGWCLDGLYVADELEDGTTLCYDADDENSCFENDWDVCGACDGLVTNVSDCPLSSADDLLPDEFNLSNIYPNPFNPSANITYALPEFSHVRVTVYDIRGRVMAVLANSFEPAGYYTIQWDASAYASGVYFIEMYSESFRKTRKVLHLK